MSDHNSEKIRALEKENATLKDVLSKANEALKLAMQKLADNNKYCKSPKKKKNIENGNCSENENGVQGFCGRACIQESEINQENNESESPCFFPLIATKMQLLERDDQMRAEEKIQELNAEKELLGEELNRLKKVVKDHEDILLLTRDQMETYKQDFNAEREERERMNEEKLKMEVQIEDFKKELLFQLGSKNITNNVQPPQRINSPPAQNPGGDDNDDDTNAGDTNNKICPVCNQPFAHLTDAQFENHVDKHLT